MLKNKKGAPRILQFKVDWSQYFHGRLNPDIPIEDSYDCGAHSLALLGVISDQTAVDLSAAQTMCFHTGRGEETKFNYLFSKYLFTEATKKYNIQLFFTPDALLEYVDDELDPGFGTFLFMAGRDSSHYVCIVKEENGSIAIADLQELTVIHDLDGYFEPYERFIIPTIIKKRPLEYEDEENTNTNGGTRQKSRKRSRKRRTRRKN
jgi:hypothetical protein